MRIGLVPGVWSYGIGSASTVLAVWEAAVRAGDEPVVFAGPQHRPLLDRLGIACVPLPGPPVAGYPAAAAPVLRLDDLLSQTVYADPAFVAGVFESQCAAFAAHGVEALFHDYDLTTIVAAHRLSIPVVSPVVWPDHRAFGWGSDGGRAPDRAAAAAFAPLLHHLRGPRPETLSDLLFDASDHLVFPVPAVLDPVVGLHAGGEYVGRLACDVLDTHLESDVDDWPRPGHRGVLAYTSGPPYDLPWYVERCTEAFDGTDVDVLLTAGRAGPVRAPGPDRGNVRVRPLVPLRKLLARSDALICHGGRNTLACAVEAGVPALVFAGRDPERRYLAEALACQGLAFSCSEADWRPDRLRALVDVPARPGRTAHPPGGADRVLAVLHAAPPQFRPMQFRPIGGNT
ncbi:hypothetical protein Q5425_41755 [Amycolatopsis sp. A133]|uniref:glycosyltransferase n=1 Tax=Amycolatopsis sp. A133 TaxID=3064472 RepID=UPI0027FAC8F7|nr:nucleotide disphospho-sugar-binding domain-containing protein [Amycolatopsis sp. A133]MDQ7810290.1 hypothetical protein [Amycolatopsis sp. A133]